MEFCKEYIKMIKSANKLQSDLKNEGIILGDYYLENEKSDEEKPKLCIEEKLKGNKVWIPRIDQLLSMIDGCIKEKTVDVEGVKNRIILLTNCYFIPNKNKTYHTYEEYLMATFMYNKYKVIWVDGKWKNEQQLLFEKLGIENDMSKTRTISIKDENGKDIGKRTETFEINEQNQTVVTGIISEYLYKK